MMSRLLLLLVTLIWFAGSSWYYTCKIKQKCLKKANQPIESVEEPVPVIKKTLPISFVQNMADAKTAAGFDRFRDSILNTLGANETLLISGLYKPSEKNNSALPNLGLARAAAAKALFAAKLDSNRIRIEGLESGEINLDEAFMGLRFGPWKNEKVRKLKNKVLVQFPQASANMLSSPEIETYFKELAQELKENPNKKVRLVGHTDDTASDEVNMKWGMYRSNAVADRLKQLGVKSSQIIATSKGESEPINPNTTDQGRRANRRVEITIVE